jgi:hypothetical protein
MILILNSEEEVEILSQLVVEELSEQNPKPRPMEEVELQLVSTNNGEEFFPRTL